MQRPRSSRARLGIGHPAINGGIAAFHLGYGIYSLIEGHDTLERVHDELWREDDEPGFGRWDDP